MLTHLLATNAHTSAQALGALAASPHLPPATRAAVLTHPNLPADAVTGPVDKLTAAHAHQVLTCPRTHPDRRTEVLRGLSDNTWHMLLIDYGDLSPTEIAARAPDLTGPQVHLSLTAAVVANANTPADIVAAALLLLAGRRTMNPMSLLMLAEQHHLEDELASRLEALIADNALRWPVQSYLDGTDRGRTLVDRALDESHSTRLLIMEQTRSLALMTAAADRWSSAHDAVRAALPYDHPHPEGRTQLRALRDRLDAAAPSADAAALRELEQFLADTSNDLVDHLARPVTVDTLRTVTRAVADLPARDKDVDCVLRQVATHPACPPELLAHIREVTRFAGAPRNVDDHATFHLTQALLSGRQRPALEVPAPAALALTPDATSCHLAGHLERALSTDPRWPLTGEGATALTTLEHTATGTLGGLLNTVHALTT